MAWLLVGAVKAAFVDKSAAAIIEYFSQLTPEVEH